MKITLPQVNGVSFAKDFMMRRARRKCEVYAAKIGSENFHWLIDNNRALYEFLKPIIAEHETNLRSNAKKYPWIATAFSDEDVISLFPHWVHEILTGYGQQGDKWIRAQIADIRDFFF